MLLTMLSSSGVTSACLCLLALTVLAGAETSSLGNFLQVSCPLPQGLCLADAVYSPGAGSVREALFAAKGVPRATSAGSRGGGPLPLNKSLVYARSLLQQAVEVEHSTIPLYLTSLYSIANSSSYAATTLHSVVIEEMLHMTMAANALNAIGGAPMIDAPGFIPTFPIHLPLTNVSVSAKRFDMESVRNFMVVESITALKKSIGGAYEYILSLLEMLVEDYGEALVFTGNYSLQVQAVAMGGDGALQTAHKIGNMSDAVVALLGVSEQGGGCPVPGSEQLWPALSNISAGPLGGTLSHYARFAEMAAGRRFRNNDTIEHGPTGEMLSIDWDAVAVFEDNPRIHHYDEGSEAHAASLAFASNYTYLLGMLHDVFNGAPERYFTTLSAMHQLTSMAQALMALPDPRNASWTLGPTWEYVAGASNFVARGGRARPIAGH